MAGVVSPMVYVLLYASLILILLAALDVSMFFLTMTLLSSTVGCQYCMFMLYLVSLNYHFVPQQITKPKMIEFSVKFIFRFCFTQSQNKIYARFDLEQVSKSYFLV